MTYKDIIFGLLLVLSVVVPSSWLLDVLGTGLESSAQDLETGLQLFRISVAFASAYAWVIMSPSASVDRPSKMQSDPVMANWLLAAILVLAFGLRMHALGVGIWYDEMLTHVHYMGLRLPQIVSSYHDANNHVLYTAVARISIDVFGDHVWAFRLPAAIFGVASIAAVYFLARRFVSWPESLAVAALMTVSYHHIWFSQNARGYTALLFFSMLSSVWFVDGIRQQDRTAWTKFAVAGALGAYTHLTIVFLFVAQFVLFSVSSLSGGNADGFSRFWTGFFHGFVLLVLLTTTLYSMVLPQIFGGALLSSGIQPSSEWTNPVWAIRETLSSLSLGFSSLGVVAAGGTVTLVGILRFLRGKWLIVGLFLVPTSLGALVMLTIGYTLFPRFFFFAMGFALIIVVHGAQGFGIVLSKLFRGSAIVSKLALIAPLAVLVLASVASLRHVYAPKQAYEEAIAFVEENASPRDRIAVIGIADFPFNAYYLKGWHHIVEVRELTALLSGGGNKWVLYTMPLHARSTYPAVLNVLEKEFGDATAFRGTLGGGEIIVYQYAGQG